MRHGRCCDHFKITLRAYEYALITKNLGRKAIWINGVGNACLKKVGNRCIFQDQNGLCGLQPLDMKPPACKVWPFVIFRNPQHRFNEDASAMEAKNTSSTWTGFTHAAG